MAQMVRLADIAQRLGIDTSTVRRLIARESDTLELEVHRGKGDKLLLTEDDANKLVASYEARRGPIVGTPDETAKFDRYGYFYLILKLIRFEGHA